MSSTAPDRWEKICDLFHEALARAPGERSTFLKDAPAGDDELLASVELLVRNYDAAHNFLDRPAPVAAADVLGFAPDCDELTGELIGSRYRIEGEIGRGGFGAVYRAADVRLHGKPVAVKVIHRYWTSSGWMRHRFEQEVEALCRIRHPGIVSVTDFGETLDSRMFLVMELIEGGTLRDLLSDGPLALERVADIVEATGKALEAAHSSGVLHRDLKPENILMAGDQVKIADFGIARIGEPGETALANTLVIGTADYMAPERMLGRCTPATDIYSLAIMACEMATGQLPQRLTTDAKPPRLPDALPIRARMMIGQALQPAESERPQSALTYSTALAASLRRGATLVDRLDRRKLLLGAIGVPLAAAGWRIEEYIRPSSIPASERVIVCPGIEPEVDDGFHPDLDIQSLAMTNEDNTGRDRRRIRTADQGIYWHSLTRGQKAQAWRKGFRLSARLLAEEGLITALVDLKGFGPRFDLIAVRANNGRVLAGVVHQISPINRLELYPVVGLPPQLTLLELVMSPVNKTAALFINGRKRAEGYRGHEQWQEDRGVGLAVGRYESTRGAGVYKDLRFEIFG